MTASPVHVSNEGHFGDVLVCKVSVDTLDEVRTLRDRVMAQVGGGDDIVYLNAPYMEAQRFVLYPQGVNGTQVPFIDLDEWAEEHGASFDPRLAMVYFDLVFEEENLEEDMDGDVAAFLKGHRGPPADEGTSYAAFYKYLEEYVAKGQRDPLTFAILRCESEALKEAANLLGGLPTT